MIKNIFSNFCNCAYLYQYLATLSGSFVIITTGINLGWTSPYLPQILNGTYPEINITSSQGSWCAVMSILGAPLGALFAVMFVDIIGRKSVILCLTPITFTMFILLAYSKTIILISLCRFLIGMVEGGLYTILPMYLGEISSPSIRGLLTSSIGMAAIIGTLFINILGFYYSIFTSAIISSIIPVVHFVTFIWMPESPYFYIKKGYLDKAKKSLQKLRGRSDVEQEMTEIIDAVARQESNKRGKLTDLIMVKSNRRAVLIFVILNSTKKFSGKNPFLYYTTMIFQSVESNFDPKYSVIIFISVEVIAMILGLLLIDRIGRRPLIMIATVGCAITLGFTGLYFYLKHINYDYIADLGWLPLTALTAYVIFYSVGLEHTPTVFIGELFPMNIKAIAHGCGDTFSVITGTVTTKLFQYVTDTVGIYLSFWIFSASCIVGLLFIAKFVPETRNKTLEEIQLDLISKTSKKVGK